MADDCTVVRFSSSDPSTARIESLKATDNSDKLTSEQSAEFGLFSATCILLSIATYILDYVLVSWLLYYYYTLGQGLYFALTLTFVVLPAILMTAFSMRWYIVDHDNMHSEQSREKTSVCKWVIRLILLMIQLAPLLRYFEALSYGLRSRVANYSDNRAKHVHLFRRMVDEDTNGALLRLFHCFLHAAPQALIQLTVLFYRFSLVDKTNNENLQTIQICTVVAGLVSVAWSITCYQRSVRVARDDKETLRWKGILVAFGWQFLGVSSRVLALSLLACMRPTWLIAVVALHWVVMWAWLALGHAHAAMCINRCEELLLSAALGIAYVFAFVANRDGPTRYSYLAYYLVCFMENTGALVVWCVSRNSDGLSVPPFLYYGAVVGQVAAFLLSLFLMAVYYRYLHPAANRKGGLERIETPPGSVSQHDKPGYSKAYTRHS